MGKQHACQRAVANRVDRAMDAQRDGGIRGHVDAAANDGRQHRERVERKDCGNGIASGRLGDRPILRTVQDMRYRGVGLHKELKGFEGCHRHEIVGANVVASVNRLRIPERSTSF